MTGTDAVLLVVVVLLVVLAALLAGADTAISRVSRVSVDELVRDRRRGAVRLRQIVADPAQFLNVLLFLRVTCQVTATVLLTLVVGDWFSASWQTALVASVSMVVVAYVLVGVGPLTLGRQHAARYAAWAAGPVWVLSRILAPLTKLLILLGNAITPGKGYREGPFASEAELRDLVDLAEESRLIEDDERQMIHSVFELGDTIAREVMVPRTDMVTIERHKTLRQALSLGLRSGFSRIPVIGDSEDDIVGVVYLKDVSRRVYDFHASETTERVESLMRPAYFTPDSKPVDELLRELQARRTHIAIAVDEYGGVAGLVTVEDILEEIVGEIADEYDVNERPEVEDTPDGDLRVSARLDVEELGELCEVEFDPDDLEDVDTVGGLLAKRLGKVAIPGAVVDVAGLRLTAESTAGRRNRIETVLVHRVDGGRARAGEAHHRGAATMGRPDDEHRRSTDQPTEAADA